MKYTTHSPEETEALAEKLAKENPAPQVFCLTGDLGAGKTAFTRGLARGYKSPNRVSSPTFTIMHQYAGEIPLYHFDLYRILDEEELYDIGFDEYVNTDGVCIIEWPDNFLSLIPQGSYMVSITRGEGENDRNIEITEK